MGPGRAPSRLGHFTLPTRGDQSPSVCFTLPTRLCREKAPFWFFVYPIVVIVVVVMIDFEVAIVVVY